MVEKCVTGGCCLFCIVGKCSILGCCILYCREVSNFRVLLYFVL